MLAPPRKDQLDSFPELVKQEFMIKEAKTDIVFSGLGWITVNEPGAKVAAYVPKGVQTLNTKILNIKRLLGTMKMGEKLVKKLFAVLGRSNRSLDVTDYA